MKITVKITTTRSMIPSMPLSIDQAYYHGKILKYRRIELGWHGNPA